MNHRNFGRRRVQRAFYTLLIWIADFIEDSLGLFRDLRPHDMPSNAAEWTTEDLLMKIKQSHELEEALDRPSDATLLKLDDATICKIVSEDPDDEVESYNEVLSMRCAYEQTTIPIPRLYRATDLLGCSDGFLVMDYIPGDRLSLAWPTLSVWTKLRVAWTLRSYVRQLRRIRHPRAAVPGPLGPGLTPRRCAGNTLASVGNLGPFADARELTAAVNKRCYSYKGVPIPRKFDEPEPLVFTHNDLYLGNIILGRDGRVWLIDWQFSGFYPRSFEFTTAVLISEISFYMLAPLSWRRCLPFIADPYFERYRWLIGFEP